MDATYRFRAGQVGNGAGDAQHAMETTR
jgi:hypothetical protein